MARTQLIFLAAIVVTVCGKALDDVHRPILVCKGDCAHVQQGEVKTRVGIRNNDSNRTDIPLQFIFKNRSYSRSYNRLNKIHFETCLSLV
jgi:hypothetical protein